MQVRSFHKWLGVGFGALLLYISLTGVWVQGVDLSAILRHAPATDPDMVAIRESLDGPGNFSVIEPTDYDAPTLPHNLDPLAATARVQTAAAKALPGQPIRYVELRMQHGFPVGQVMAGDTLLRFDAATGTRLPDAPKEKGHPPQSNHLLAKRWHRMWTLGDGMLWLDALCGIALGALTVLGLILWFRMWRMRVRIKRPAIWWKGGGTIRMIHRGLAPLAALPLLVVAISGTILSIDSLSMQIFRWRHPDQLAFHILPIGMIADYSSPLAPGAAAAMARTTLAAHGTAPLRVLRLRTFAGMPQGVIVTGQPLARQVIVNTATGQPAGLAEPNYPDTVFPTGWAWHEWLKQLHRGDALGLPGRLLDLLAGLSLMWFAGSGLWMWYGPWQRKRKAG